MSEPFVAVPITVSVIMPLHNKERYVGQTVRTLREQTHRQWELIVVENHSEDTGPDIVMASAATDPRIRLVRAPSEVRGPSAARQLGMKLSKGQFVLFLDADDLLEPHHIETLIDAISANGAQIAVSDYLHVKADIDRPEQLHREAGKVVRTSDAVRGGLTLDETLVAFAPWPPHCGLIRRDILFDGIWPIELDRFASEDTVFWFRVLSGRKRVFTKRCTAIYRSETLNARDCFRDILRWSQAMEQVVATNVADLQAAGVELNAGQCEAICRLWESVGDRALLAGEQSCAESAFARSQEWLNQFVQRDRRWRMAIILRRVLGIRLASRLRSMCANARMAKDKMLEKCFREPGK